MGLAAFNRMRQLSDDAKKAEKKPVDFSLLKKAEMQAKLTELGVEFDASLNKDDLLALLQEKTK